jgi:hypothetical protein
VHMPCQLGSNACRTQLSIAAEGQWLDVPKRKTCYRSGTRQVSPIRAC